MNGKTLDNVLSIDQINYLKTLRKNLNGRVDSKKGRELRPVPSNDFLSKDIEDKLTDIASSFYGKKLKLYAVAFGRYSAEFGIPKLPPHIDEVPSQFTLDYQLDGNIEWAIIIEGNEYLLKNNSALVFEGEHVLHWRPKRNFKSDEFIDLMWFQFIDSNHWSYNAEIRPDYKEFKTILSTKLKKWESIYNEL